MMIMEKKTKKEGKKCMKTNKSLAVTMGITLNPKCSLNCHATLALVTDGKVLEF